MTTRTCDGCGQANVSTADFCANPECRTYLGWSSAPGAVGAAWPAPAARAVGGTAPPAGTATQPTGQAAPPPGQRAGVRIRLDPPEVAVDPGGAATVRVGAENTGTRVEQLDVVVHGAAGAFARPEPARLSVYPGRSEQAVVTFRPPQGPRPPGGPAPFGVELRSAVNPGVGAVASGVVTVTPFVAVTAELTPGATRGRRAGRHTVVVENHGNVPTTAFVEWRDHAGVVVVRPAATEVTVPPGERVPVAASVHGPRRLFGQPRSYEFTATVGPRRGQPAVTLRGVRHQRARLGFWRLVLGALLFAGLVVVAAEAATRLRDPGGSGVVDDGGQDPGGDSGEDPGGDGGEQPTDGGGEQPTEGDGEEGALAPGYGRAGPASRAPDSEVRR